jgi:hypothetical protein
MVGRSTGVSQIENKGSFEYMSWCRRLFWDTLWHPMDGDMMYMMILNIQVALVNILLTCRVSHPAHLFIDETRLWTCFPKNFREAYYRCCVRPSACPSSHLHIELLSEIDGVDNKCLLTQGLVDQGLWSLFWKVQGHSEHIKESNFNISSCMKFTFHQKLS